ncbi:MAG: murein biosynthesis integral membrane protein MurJ [Patescibacteria group bacterium]
MAKDFLWKKSLDLITKRQTNILSAAFVIMATVILSQVLGLIRQRLLVGIFGASDTLGIYFYASQLPDTLFQLTIAAALTSAFIPVFSDFLTRGKEKQANIMASTLLMLSFFAFFVLAILLAIFTPFFLGIFNLGNNFSPEQMTLMANLTRIIIFGQIFFILGTFFTALLQSYNHFFVPGFAAALYNLGIIIGVIVFAPLFGIYSATIGVILGGIIFVLVQVPLTRKVGFRFTPVLSEIKSEGIKKIGTLMWPRTLAIVVFQLGTVAVGSLISFLPDPGRMNVIFDFAKTLAFAPVALFGQTIAQAAFPVLSREKERIADFKVTFITSFNQMLYLVLPVSVLILILRIPLVRLVFGASKFDWPATVLTGQTLAFFSLSIFAQALITLILRAFYALHDTKIPLIINALSTAILVIIAYLFIVVYHFGVQSLAIAFTISSIFQLIILFILLDKRVGGFNKLQLLLPWTKFFISSVFTAFALYIPIKLLDQLVFDTTRTINLIILAGISSLAGLSLYLFFTWFFDVKEAQNYLQVIKKVGNWRAILAKSQEVLEGGKINQ